MLVYGVFYALTEPAEKLLVTRWSGRVAPGLAFGWFHLTIGIGSLPASLLCGALYQVWGPLAAFGLGAALSFVAGLLLIAVPDASSARV
jgi:predicted MFS family arabinose efflux permease